MKQCYTIITLAYACTSLSISNSFAEVFWSEDFSGGFPTGEWLNQGPALWMHCDDPETCPPNVYAPNNSPGFGIFRSPTADNGYLYYNSNSWLQPHEGILRTPTIDISNQEAVFLEFYTHIATKNKAAEPNALLQIITPDETLTFKVFPGLWEPLVASSNAYRVNFDLSPYLEGVDNITIQWYWDGYNEYSWSIDDIKLSNTDLTLPPNTCWSERFAFGMEGWTSNNLSEPDALWEWVLGGDISPAYFAEAGDVIQSPSGVDGAAVFNSEYLLSGGSFQELIANYPHFFRSELISPPIDLSCYENALELHYSQLIKKANEAPNAPLSAQQEKLITSISWSTDGGESWSTPIDASPTVKATFNPYAPIIQQRIVLPLPPELSGVTDLRLRFTWAGDLFFWALDDIAISERLPFDMRVNNNFFAIMPNAMTPVGQVGETAFLADLSNVGYQDATGVNLDLNITHDATGETIYTDQLNFPTVVSDELIENVFFEERLGDQHIPRTGAYHGIYQVSQDSVDGRPENDTINWAFVISDSTFAKELGPTRNITAADTEDFTYGNCFFIPNGAGKYARWITVGIENADSLAVSNAEISTFFYKWEDTNDNNLAEPGEYDFIESNRGFNSYQFSSMEDDDGFITLPIHFEGDGIPLEDSTYYLVAVQYISSNGRTCNFMASEQFNYQATTFISDSLQQNRYSSILDLNNTGTFDFIGFGLDVVPVVRLHIGDTSDLSIPGIIVSSNESPIFEPQYTLDVFPNPNQGQFKVAIRLKNLSRYVGMKLLNMSGSILFSENFENIKENQFTLKFPTIPPGTYLLQVQTDDQILSKKIVVQH